jgi:DNA gyrase subunit A
MMATRKGMIKKTPLSDFINLRKSGLIAVNLRDEDALIGVQLTDGSREVMLATRRGKSIRFRESSVRSTGRASQGVRSIRLINNDEVVSMSAVEEDKQVLCISSHGYGKRTNVNEYRGQERGGKGVMVMNLTEKTGDLASMLMVDQDDELMIITDDGTIIRTPAGDIRECGRVTQGVRLMRVGEGSRIVDVDIAAPEDDEGIVDSVERPDAPEEEFSENNEPDEL